MKLCILLLCLHVAMVLAGGETFCNIPPVKLMGATSLTCTFPEDISQSKRDFSVVHVNSTGKPILDCLWLEGKLDCFNTSGYVFNMIVGNTLTIEIPRTFSNMTGLYYCKTSSSSKDVQYCKLETLKDTTNSDENVLPMAIGISLGLIGVGAIIAFAIIFILKRRRRPTDHQSSIEVRPMIDRKTHLHQEQRREEVTKKFQEHLENKTREMYPNIFDAFYFVPPVYLNKTKYTKSVAHPDVYIPELPDQNDVRHDQAMQHVLHCLRHLAERGQEQMFVITQFQYKDYLKNVSRDFEEHRLPVPASLPQDVDNTCCFDFLIIHRRHGVIAGVVKVLKDNEKDGRDVGTNDVVKEVSSALQRFKKTCHIVSHVMSDQQPGLNIKQLLVLFNINQLTFQHSLATQNTVLEKLKMSWPICLGRLFDHNIRHGIDPTSLIQFEKLWERMTTEKPNVFMMSDELYLTMIARFCGPATISVISSEPSELSESVSYQLPKTLDQAVSLTGDMFERFTLYPDMTDLLEKPRLCLAGPPGTGKTKMLALVGRKWISAGHGVEIIYSSLDGAAAAYQLKKLLNGTNQSPPRINCYLQEGKIKNTIEILKEKAEKHPVFAILDEMEFQKLRGKSFKSLLSKLGDSSNLHMWLAGCTTEHLDIKQPELQLFTNALSCPPSILRQAQQEDVSFLDHYTDSLYPAPTEGPPVKHFYHVGQGHSLEEQPHGCKCCANNIAGFLTQTLRIGAEEQNDTAIQQETSIQSLKPFSRLRYRDVLIFFECDVDKDTPMVKSLKSSGIHVNVINHTSQSDDIEDDTNAALVAKAGELLGLKRKIVVFVKGGTDMDEVSARWNRVRCFTSCRSQLVLLCTLKS